MQQASESGKLFWCLDESISKHKDLHNMYKEHKSWWNEVQFKYGRGKCEEFVRSAGQCTPIQFNA